MWRALLIPAVLISTAAAQDRWVYLHSDGFELFTNAGARAGRVELVRLERFRHSPRRNLGKTDPAIPPPAPEDFFKKARDAAPYEAPDPILKSRQQRAPILPPQ